MANVRFLDQVAVSAFALDTTANGRVPRFLYAGETLVVSENQQLVGYDFYNLGLVVINSGSAVNINGTIVYSDGLLQIQTILDNSGTIINNGILINSETIY